MKMGVALVLIAATACYLRKGSYQEKKWRMFILTITISTFVNMATAFQFYISFSYTMVLQLLYILIDLLCGKKKLEVNKKVILSFLLFALSIGIGFALLVVNVHKYLPVVPFSITVDEVYMRRASASIPTFGYANKSAFVILLLFCAFVFTSRIFFEDGYWVKKTQDCFIKIYRIYFVFIIIEFIINNSISPYIIRNITMTIFGSPSRGYTYSQQRNGMYAVNSLFSEPSYVIVSLFYFAFIIRKEVKSNKDIVWNIVGIICMILSGASMGFTVIPFAILATLWSGQRPSLRNKVNLKRWAMLIIVGIAAIVMIYSQRYRLFLIFDSTIEKISAYLFTDITNKYVSGSIRQFGNSLAYAAFKDMPLFGYGLGTTRGYGIIPGALAAFGAIGCITYCYFMKNACCVKLDFAGWVILSIFALYGTSVLSIWYLYEPAILLCFLSITNVCNAKTIYAVNCKNYYSYSRRI